MRDVARKWRPSMAVVVAMVCGLLVSIPVLAFLGMRLSSNQFVRETEQGLINQAAILAEIYAEDYAALGAPVEGRALTPAQIAHWTADLHPWAPRLNLRRSEVLPPLPDYVPAPVPETPDPTPADPGSPVPDGPASLAGLANGVTGADQLARLDPDAIARTAPGSLVPLERADTESAEAAPQADTPLADASLAEIAPARPSASSPPPSASLAPPDLRSPSPRSGAGPDAGSGADPDADRDAAAPPVFSRLHEGPAPPASDRPQGSLVPESGLAPRAAQTQSAPPPPLPPARSRAAQSASDPRAPRPVQSQLLTPYHQLSPGLLTLARAARGTTLSGAIFLDANGVDIRPDQPQDLSFAPEVQAALEGRVGSALRDRGETFDRHPLTSISRDTWYRVFVAFPVILENRVIGVVYMSRTPSNFAKFVLTERGGVIGMLLATLAAAGAVAWLLLRLFSKPLRALSAQSRDIATGRLAEPVALSHYGTSELADLGQNMMQMAETLTARSRQIAIYTDHVTHELKSPVTAILGAAELLGSDKITPDTAETLRRNIEGQALRMNTLLEKLREMSRLRHAPTRGSGPLAGMLPVVDGLEITVALDSDPILPLLPEHGEIVFGQLARNALEHGATRLRVRFRDGELRVDDNGQGIAAGDLDRVTTPFFTTRREEGGTGLGLAIVVAVLQNYDADLRFEPCETGASLRIRFGDGAGVS